MFFVEFFSIVQQEKALVSGKKGPKQHCLKIAIAVTGAAQCFLRSVNSRTDPKNDNAEFKKTVL